MGYHEFEKEEDMGVVGGDQKEGLKWYKSLFIYENLKNILKFKI